MRLPTARQKMFTYVTIGAVVTLMAALGFMFPRKQTVTRPTFPKNAYAKSFYDEALAWAKDHPATKEDAAGLIINHHLLARHLAARTLLAASDKKPRRIIIISPDHFLRGETDMTVASADFDTPYGVAQTDDAAVAALADAGVARIDNGAMYYEHGIQGIMPLVKAAFPNAKVVAIMMKSDAKDVAPLVAALAHMTDTNDLIIDSLDFSHNLTGPAADFHDRMSLSVLRGDDFSGVDRLDIDCRSCIRAMFGLMAARGTQRFDLIDNTNSANLVGLDTVEESTSYINGAFVKGTPKNDDVATAMLLPIEPGKGDWSAFEHLLDPEREGRFFYGQDLLLGWHGAVSLRMATEFGMVALSNRELETRTPRDIPVTVSGDGNGGITLTCEGRILHYRTGGTTFSLTRDADTTTFTVPHGLSLDDTRNDTLLALGATCRKGALDITPFFLTRDATHLRLVPYAEQRVYLERYFSLHDDVLHVGAH